MAVRRRRRSSQLTPLELEVMEALWGGGAGTVQAVQKRLPTHPPLAYNTVQTVLTILHRKKQVSRTLVGKAFVYEAMTTRERAARRALSEIIEKLFAGSPSELVMSLIGTEKLTRADLRRIRLLIKKYEDASE